MGCKPTHTGLLGDSWNSIEGAGLEENPATVTHMLNDSARARLYRLTETLKAAGY